MPHYKSFSDPTARSTGFPEQFVGTTQRHPEARNFSTPWEPKEVDMVRRARQLSMMRHQMFLARQLELDEEDEEDDDEFDVSPVSHRKRTTFPPAKNPSNFLQLPEVGISAIPSGSHGHQQRPVSAAGSSSPTNSSPTSSSFSAAGEDMARPITACEKGGTNMGPAMGHTHSHSQGSTGGYEYHQPWTPNPHAIALIPEKPGWASWASKFGEWRKVRRDRQRSRSNSMKMG